MKKIIILLAAVLSINATFAQNRNDHYNDHQQQAMQTSNNNWNNNDQNQWKGQDQRRDQGQWKGQDQRGYDNNGRMDKNRQAEYDRMNQQYDQRIDGYRNDRSINNFERQRRINDAEKERQQKQRSFGTGLVVGGIAAILLGALFSN